MAKGNGNNDIWVALIGAVATVIVAAIGCWSKSSARERRGSNAR